MNGSIKRMIASRLVHFAAMRNHVNRDTALPGIGCVQHPPVSNPQFVQMRKIAGQRFKLDLVIMSREPFDLFHNPFRNGGIELGKILTSLWRKVYGEVQESFSRAFTFSKEVRSVESRDDWSLAFISSLISRFASGSIMMFCSSSCTTFLIKVCNSSTLRSAAFMGLPFSNKGLSNGREP